jgi:alkylation response protein AidB-like acyl-CoA dehydrogenase
MPIYNPPIKDMHFLIQEYLRVQDYNTIPVLNTLSDDIIEPILSEAGRLCQQVLLPLNQVGDKQGCFIKDKKVIAPQGFKQAYDAFCQGGWTALNCHSQYGGQDMPIFLGSMISEMASSANMAFAMYAGLTHGAYSAIFAHGSEAQKNLYLPKLASGEWTGTMNLTESHCGTDLGLLKTKAIPNTDGLSYKITGQKIFISAGDHELSENIIHLVLARLPNAPDGIKGISLFIVPKFIPKNDGTIGERNHVTCSKLEEKMGIHGNSTCVMDYDEATGFLIGEPNAGLTAMFVMMNEARLNVGIQGLSQSEIAYQNAVNYAKDRLQGRSVAGIKETSKNADPIIHHLNIRKTLMHAKAFNEGARAFLAEIGLKIDISHYHPNETVKANADAFVSLMTPIAKGYITDKAFDITVQAQQVFGGHGYIHEWGMEQYVRDSRIAMIYEGTNDIQALDLVARKLPKNGGAATMAYIQEISAFIKEHQEILELEKIIGGLKKCRDALQKNCLWLMEHAMKDSEQAVAVASNMMHLFGITALAYSWTKIAVISTNILKNNPQDTQFYQNKLITAHFFINHYVPEIETLSIRIHNGKESIVALKINEF